MTIRINSPVCDHEPRCEPPTHVYTPPTPDEIDTLLARISATGYASEAVWITETWIEQRYGVVGAFTANQRAEERCCRACGVREEKCARYRPLAACCESCDHPAGVPA